MPRLGSGECACAGGVQSVVVEDWMVKQHSMRCSMGA